MQNRCLLAMAVVLLVLTGCSVVSGSGQVASETRQVSGFTGIDLSGVGEVIIEQGQSESLTIEADDNVLPVLTSEVEDSVLRLDRKPRNTVTTRNPIRYRVTLQDLTSLELSGSGSVSAENLRVNALRVDISGSGTIKLCWVGRRAADRGVRLRSVRRRGTFQPVGGGGHLGKREGDRRRDRAAPRRHQRQRHSDLLR